MSKKIDHIDVRMTGCGQYSIGTAAANVKTYAKQSRTLAAQQTKHDQTVCNNSETEITTSIV